LDGGADKHVGTRLMSLLAASLPAVAPAERSQQDVVSAVTSDQTQRTQMAWAAITISVAAMVKVMMTAAIPTEPV
jgi:hypothetical protein